MTEWRRWNDIPEYFRYSQQIFIISSVSFKTQNGAIEVTIRDNPKILILIDTSVAPENTTHWNVSYGDDLWVYSRFQLKRSPI